MKATIEQMLSGHEGKTLEFKSLLSSPEPFLKTVIAFANTAGGTILFGVEDRTRRVVGVADPLEVEARIANLVSDAIRPRLAPEIEIHPWRRTAANRCFDEEPLPDLDSEAIDFRAASELFAPLRRLTARDLAVLGKTTRCPAQILLVRKGVNDNHEPG